MVRIVIRNLHSVNRISNQVHMEETTAKGEKERGKEKKLHLNVVRPFFLRHEYKAGFMRLGQPPHSKRMIPTPGDDQRSLRPPLLSNRRSSRRGLASHASQTRRKGRTVLDLNVQQLRLHNRQTANSALVTAKDVRTFPLFQIPDPHRPIGGAADEGVLRRREGPHTTAVAFEGLEEGAVERVIDVDRMIVGSGDDAIVGEQETSYDGGTVGGKGDAFGVQVGLPLGAGELTGFEEDFVRVREVEGALQGRSRVLLFLS